MSILDHIFAHKRLEIERCKLAKPQTALETACSQAPAPGDFVKALMQKDGSSRQWPALIAEVKRASPSRGELAPGMDALQMAKIYQENGAAALSVLTDEMYFKGKLDDLRQVSSAGLGLPVLRKDFICDSYQVYEARSAGADAVLLIAAHLEVNLLHELHDLVRHLGMTPLVEIHNREELNIALECDPLLLGINNRDLHTFAVHLDTTLNLRPFVPAGICLVAESGIHTREDVACLAQAGVQAILVGEALVTAKDIAGKVRSLA